MCSVFFFFFFQAEDGIRDLVRSRGLGDVYKRQAWELARARGVAAEVDVEMLSGMGVPLQEVILREAVSYTHLTLPTSDLV